MHAPDAAADKVDESGSSKFQRPFRKPTVMMSRKGGWTGGTVAEPKTLLAPREDHEAIHNNVLKLTPDPSQEQEGNEDRDEEVDSSSHLCRRSGRGWNSNSNSREQQY